MVVIRGIQAIQWTGPRQCHGMPAQRRQFRGRRVQEHLGGAGAGQPRERQDQRGVRAPGELAPDPALRSEGIECPCQSCLPAQALPVRHRCAPRAARVGRAGHQRRSHDRAGRTDTARRNHRKPGRDRVGARRAAAGRLETLAGGVLWDEIFSIIWSRAIWTREVLVHASVRRGRVCRPSAREFRARSEPVEAVRAGARRSPGAAGRSGRSGRSAPAPGPRSHRGLVRGRGRRA